MRHTNSENVRALVRSVAQSDPVAACLISGEWGAGKTQFLRTNVELVERETRRKLLIVSVAGLKTREDLDQALFAASAPWLFTGYAQAASIFAKAALRFVKIEPKDLKRLSANLNNDCVAVVIEDLDRFSGDLEVVFGLVIDLVDQFRVNTVLVAAERTLFAKGVYREWKEKIVGATIFVEPSIAEMIDIFIKEIPSGEAREKLHSYHSDLAEVAEDWGLLNLRSVKYAIHEMGRLVTTMQGRLSELGSMESILIKGCFLGLLEIRRDASAAELIAKLFSHSGLSEGALAQLAGAANDEDASEESVAVANIINRYPKFHFSLLPGGDVFHRYFRTGQIDTDHLVLAFRPATQADSRRERFLRDYLSMSQEDFDDEYSEIREDLSDGRIASMSVLARVYLSLRYLAERRLIDLAPPHVKNLVLACIRQVEPGNVIDPEGDDDFWYVQGTDEDLREVQSAIEFARAAARDAAVADQRASVFRRDSVSFVSKLQQWRDRPLFLGSSREAYDSIMGLTAAELQDLIRLFGSRRHLSDFSSRFSQERPVLLGVAELLRETVPASSEPLSILDSQLTMLALAMDAFANQLSADPA